MEGFFCGFRNFFTDPYRSGQRQQQQSAQQCRCIRQKIAHLQHPAAQQQKVYPRPAKYAQYRVDAHLSIAYRQRIDKQSHRYDQPKKQIQRAGHQTQPDTHPQDAQHIIQHAHRCPQQQRSGKRERLSGDGDFHLSQTAGQRTRRPGPARCPHRLESRCFPPPADLLRPGSASRCAGFLPARSDFPGR